MFDEPRIARTLHGKNLTERIDYGLFGVNARGALSKFRHFPNIDALDPSSICPAPSGLEVRDTLQ
jgi:hypothetical protein